MNRYLSILRTGRRLTALLLLTLTLPASGEAVAAGLYGDDYLTIDVGELRFYDNAWFHGDFDGDGRSDFLICGGSGKLLVVGRRGGGFEAARQIDDSRGQREWQTADLDGDGLTDLVTVSEDVELGYQLGRGPSGFAPFLPIVTRGRVTRFRVLAQGAAPPLIAVTLDDSSAAEIYRRGDSGEWTLSGRIPVRYSSDDLFGGDVDGDGREELVTLSPVSGGMHWLSYSFAEGAPSPPDTLRLPYSFSFDPERTKLADLDADGSPELITSIFRGIRILRRLEDGRYADAWRSEEFEARQFQVGDFCGDATLDIAALSSQDGRVICFTRNAGLDFTRSESRLIPSGSSGLLGGRFLGDRTEIATLQRSGGSIAIVNFRETERTTNLTTLRPPVRSRFDFAVGDMNEDGRPDIVLSTGLGDETGTMWVAFGNGTRELTLVERPSGIPASSHVLADLDGDGHLDVLAVSERRSALWWFPGDGRGDIRLGHEIYRGTDSPFEGGARIATADLDGDADQDIVVAGRYQSLWFFRNAGQGRFDPPVIEEMNGDVVGLSTDNQDGGRAWELSALTFSPGVLRTYRLAPSGQVVKVRQQDAISRSEGYTIADLDGDCRDDLVIRAGVADRVTIQRGLGGGIYAPPTTERMGRVLSWVTASDLDGDGRAELIAYVEGSGLMLVRRGAATGLSEVIEESGIGGRFRVPPRFADLDGDDRPELLAIDDYDPENLRIYWNAEPAAPPPDAGTPLTLSPMGGNPSRGDVMLDVAGLTRGTEVNLDVFDVAGRRVGGAAPVRASAERICLGWNGRGSDGRPAASGAYWLLVRSGSASATVRVTVIR